MSALWSAKPQVSCAATRGAGVVEHDKDGAEWWTFARWDIAFGGSKRREAGVNQ